ncbi:MAG TPA: OB-fold nucleic acid binding domain-containing protein [Acidimicrobiales bacterium]|nr:OB-fold nucleic acid binding domain-containing protein [Acidimicrobiales bacterium]
MALTSFRHRSLPIPVPAPQTEEGDLDALTDGCVPIADVSWRQAARFVGRVRSLRVQPWADVATLECTLVDDTGGVTVVFLGRRRIPGITLGRSMIVEGMAGAHHGKLALLNPDYTLLPPAFRSAPAT